jgi:hypothetical protein
VVIGLNLLVHVFMYYYFAMASIKARRRHCPPALCSGLAQLTRPVQRAPAWKRWLTVGQISQFVLALCACLAAFLPHLLHDLGLTVRSRQHARRW